MASFIMFLPDPLPVCSAFIWTVNSCFLFNLRSQKSLVIWIWFRINRRIGSRPMNPDRQYNGEVFPLSWTMCRYITTTLKVPKCEIFDPFFFTPINPIWVGDLRTGEKKNLFRRLRQIFAILFFLRRLSLR
jgi:hypothetical protein